MWSDYDGDSIYGDFSVTAGTETELTSFEPGIGRVVDPLGTPSSSYYHTDMLGTTRLMTDSIGIGSAHTVCTAFGQPVSGTNHRYGYAGAHGYQAHDIGQTGDAFPYLHVGARYLDPSTGRFLQRDPIGISGGLNVYVYVTNTPTVAVDPTGQQPKSFWPPNRGRWRYGPSKPPGAPAHVRKPAFRFPGPKGGTHVWGAPGAMLFGGCVLGAVVVGTAGGLAIDHFVVKPEQEDWYDKNARSQDGSMSPHDDKDPWGWVPPGSSWERQRDRWREKNG